jgi:hypothetical protein
VNLDAFYFDSFSAHCRTVFFFLVFLTGFFPSVVFFVSPPDQCSRQRVGGPCEEGDLLGSFPAEVERGGHRMDEGGVRIHSPDRKVDGSWRRRRVKVLPWRPRSCFRQTRRKEQAPSADRVSCDLLSSFSHLIYVAAASFILFVRPLPRMLARCIPRRCAAYVFSGSRGGFVGLCGHTN